jgi:hypothetical protein
MTFAVRPSELTPCGKQRPADGRGATRRRGLLRRIYDAVFESRQKQADRVVEAYLDRTGGRFTDEIERRITMRLISGDWHR